MKKICAMVFAAGSLTSCAPRQFNADTAASPSASNKCPSTQEEKCKKADMLCLALPNGVSACSRLPAEMVQDHTAVWSDSLGMYVIAPRIPSPPQAPVPPMNGQFATCIQLKAEVGCDAYCQPKFQDCWIATHNTETQCKQACDRGE